MLDLRMMSEIIEILPVEQLELMKVCLTGKPVRPFGPPEELIGPQEE
jgi:hypothetical protein